MVIENKNLQITPLLPSVPCMDGSVKIFIPISEGINKKKFYDHRDFELVDDESLS